MSAQATSTETEVSEALSQLTASLVSQGLTAEAARERIVAELRKADELASAKRLEGLIETKVEQFNTQRAQQGGNPLLRWQPA